MKEKLPNFLIVGAAKAGTTSLYHYLKEHPSIYLNPYRKELRFFSKMKPEFKGPGDENVNKSITKNIEEYKTYFRDVKNEIAIGDISPDYLYFYENSILNIKNYLGDPKIIIILRNPIERAFSHWLHFVRDNREFLSFEDALNEEEKRKRMNWEWAWYYKDVGFYYNQVKAYINSFSNVRIYLYDDLKNSPINLVQSIYSFLEVDDSFVPSSINEKHNVSGIPKNEFIYKTVIKNRFIKSYLKPFIPDKYKIKIKTMIQKKFLEKPKMNPETREYLKNLYREDILKLQDLIDRDLSHWLK